MKSKVGLMSGLILILLAGCAGSIVEGDETAQVENTSESGKTGGDQAYDIALEKGLEGLENEGYEKAEAYFEIALEEGGDERADALLEQTRTYVAAWDLYEQEDYEKARVKAEVVRSIERGSDTLTTRADKLLDELDAVAAAEQSEEERFEAFKGMYVEFEGKSYESLYDRFLVLTDEKYIEGVSNAGVPNTHITGKYFDGDALILDLYTPEEEGSVLQKAISDQSLQFLMMKTGINIYRWKMVL